MKKQNGITIISLVITIIILIILAGVSLNLTLGQNGIITKAKQAKENIELAKVEEETRLNELYMQIETEGGITGDISYDAIAKIKDLENKLSNLQDEFNNLQNEYNTFKTTIAEAITDMGVATAENADASTMASNIRSVPFKHTDLSNAKITNVLYYSRWYVSIDISVSKGEYLVLTAIHADNSLTSPGVVTITGADETENYIPFIVNGVQASDLSKFTCNSDKTIRISHSNGNADGNGHMFYVIIKL